MMSYLVEINAKVLETKDKDKCLTSRNKLGQGNSRGSRGLRLACHEAHVALSMARSRTVLLLLRSLTWSIRRVARMTAARVSYW